MGGQSQYNLEGRGGDNEGQRSRSTTATRSEIESEYYSRGRGNSNRTAPDRGSTYQSSGTFYREPTPPPRTRDTNLDASSTTNILHKAGEFYDYQYDHVAPPAPIPSAAICGITARLFWIVLGIVGLVVAIALGVGLGIGLGVNHKSSAQPSPVTTSTGLPHTSTTLATSISTSKTGSATQPPSSHLSCPTSNGTVYDVPDSQKSFTLFCGIDYSGVNEATDLTNLYTIDILDCINSCANYPGCMGCGWGILPEDGGSSLHRCWLKGSLKKTHTEKTGWYFAVLRGT